MVLELQEIHNAESQLSRVLPRLSKSLQSEQLRAMVEQRLTEGETIISDIENVLEEIDKTPGRKKNVAAEGLINDMREHAQEIEEGAALDAVLLAAIQKTEHYCIAAWGTAKALASAVGQDSAVQAMQRALDEGREFDQQLTDLAQRELTPALLESEGDDQEEDPVPRAVRNKNGGSEKRA
jgi:ferritin-like metal-binding protein YciE